MKTGPNLKYTANAASQSHTSFSGGRDAAKDFQQGRFSCSVPADNSYDLTLGYFEGDILDRPKIFARRRGKSGPAKDGLATLNHRVTKRDIVIGRFARPRIKSPPAC